MHADLVIRRRFLLRSDARYRAADAAWRAALAQAATWFPQQNQGPAFPMGNPGSPLRRLYEQRALALRQLEAARLRLETKRARLAAMQASGAPAEVFLLTLSRR